MLLGERYKGVNKMAGNVVKKIDDLVKVETALISVSDKARLHDLVLGLLRINPKLLMLSTGGTYKEIENIIGELVVGDVGRNLMQVSEYTGQPETQGGLVKTLDFKIYLGLLTETYNASHEVDLQRTGARPIDLVVCNLYPFAETIKKQGVTPEDARANIDIGGPTMIRAAAKNHLRVAVVVDPRDYGILLSHLADNGGKTNFAMRHELAARAFKHTAQYDIAIADYFFGVKSEKALEVYPTVHNRGE